MTQARRVLLVDDNSALLENLSEIIEETGAEVEVALSGAQALQRLDTGRYDLVLTDMRMPGMNGVAVLKEIHRRWPGLPTLVMTAYSRDALLDEAWRHGALAILAKPLDIKELLGLVTRFTGEETAPILLVEDDEALAVNLGQALLDVSGAVPHRASNLAEARRLAAELDFRLAVIDVRLPDGDGRDLGRELQAGRGDTPPVVIFISGHGTDRMDDLPDVAGGGGVHFLQKPFPTAKLLALIASEI